MSRLQAVAAGSGRFLGGITGRQYSDLSTSTAATEPEEAKMTALRFRRRPVAADAALRTASPQRRIDSSAFAETALAPLHFRVKDFRQSGSRQVARQGREESVGICMHFDPSFRWRSSTRSFICWLGLAEAEVNLLLILLAEATRWNKRNSVAPESIPELPAKEEIGPRSPSPFPIIPWLVTRHWRAGLVSSSSDDG